MWKAVIAACLVLCSRAACAEAATEELFGPDGYRIAHYRGPVPGPPAGVHRIDAAAVARLRPDVDAILIDVFPAEGGHREADGSWRLASPRPSIPGAHWFPEAGRGMLDPDIGQWFERGVARLTGHSKKRMVVTFCLADCWMSWNAARRLRAMGYANVWWFAEGTNGWRDLDHPLVPATPER
jgi:PQQ-dependent catabolism-associated CXXCW motif protein